MTSKLDRRKKYTHMVLKESLIKLLKEKKISSVTVKEICEQADINRSTFYSHYSDHYDLLNKIEEEMIEDMNKTLSAYNLSEKEEALQMTENVFEYLATNRDVCQTLLSENGDTYFQKRVMMITQQYTMKNWMADNISDETMSEYISLLVISGSIHVIQSWLNNGMDKSPKEMAAMINNFANKGLSSLQ